MMQDLVGIVRDEGEMQQALDGLGDAEGARRRSAGVTGHREYNPGWHTALDLGNLLTVSEAITRSAIERKESRGGHFREDYPGQGPGVRDLQHRRAPRAGRRDGGVARSPMPPMPPELKQIIEENEVVSRRRPSASGAANREQGGHSSDYPTEVSEGMVVLDAVHHIQAEQADDLARPLELQGRQVRLVLGRDQRQAAADVHDAARHARPARSRSPSSRCARSR